MRCRVALPTERHSPYESRQAGKAKQDNGFLDVAARAIDDEANDHEREHWLPKIIQNEPKFCPLILPCQFITAVLEQQRIRCGFAEPYSATTTTLFYRRSSSLVGVPTNPTQISFAGLLTLHQAPPSDPKFTCGPNSFWNGIPAQNSKGYAKSSPDPVFRNEELNTSFRRWGHRKGRRPCVAVKDADGEVARSEIEHAPPYAVKLSPRLFAFAGILDGILDATNGILNLACSFIGRSFHHQFRIANCFANNFLGSALNLLRRPCDPILVKHV